MENVCLSGVETKYQHKRKCEYNFDVFHLQLWQEKVFHNGFFTLYLYKNKIKKNLTTFPNKNVCAGCKKIICETYSVYMPIQDIYVLNIIDV